MGVPQIGDTPIVGWFFLFMDIKKNDDLGVPSGYLT